MSRWHRTARLINRPQPFRSATWTERPGPVRPAWEASGRTLNHSCTDNLALERVTVLDTLVGQRRRRRSRLAIGDPLSHPQNAAVSFANAEPIELRDPCLSAFAMRDGALRLSDPSGGFSLDPLMTDQRFPSPHTPRPLFMARGAKTNER